MALDLYGQMDYFRERNYFFKLYNEMVCNWKLDISEFVNNIKNNVNKDFDTIDKIFDFVDGTKTSYSVAKSNIMISIIEYLQGKKEKDEVQEIIDKVEKRPINMQPKKDIRDHEGNIKRIISNMNAVINDERSYKELAEKKEIPDDLLFTKANLYIKEIDDDTYLDFVIKYKGLEKLSLEELKQYQSLLKVFITNLSNKVNKLTVLVDDKDIINFYVKGQENLTTYHTSKINRLKAWKLKKLSSLLTYYNEMYKMLDEIINTKSAESIKKIKLDKDVMAQEEDFIIDYHNALQNISSGYAYIKKIHNVTDDRNKTLCKKFNEKIIVENN